MGKWSFIQIASLFHLSICIYIFFSCRLDQNFIRIFGLGLLPKYPLFCTYPCGYKEDDQILCSVPATSMVIAAGDANDYVEGMEHSASVLYSISYSDRNSTQS